MTESFFIDLVSGQSRGILPSSLRAGLSVAEPFYGCAVGLRNALFDAGLKRVHQAERPVISVGNVTTGGTGKTPTVAWLVNWLQQQHETPAILSRGYQSLDGEANDEKLLLDQLCPGVSHLQNRDRVTGAARLIQDSSCSVIVLDDGFQHRRLHRDFDLVLIDALTPWGHGHLLPRGLLRESLRSLRRADAILLTRCDLVTATRLKELKTQLSKMVEAPVIASAFTATGLVNSSGVKLPFADLNGKRTCSFAGIGNPGGFRRTLSGVGLAVSDNRFRAFPDHYHYTQDDLNNVAIWATTQYAEALIVTRKDLVKIRSDQIGRIPLWAVDIELEFLETEPLLQRTLADKLSFLNVERT
ncbi:tetraacyldisaccharide 4'-kinase [Thalassoglobus polymorphus]|uniref:Tetraacyldisaccharide 4'-kinase n=1 Tax=Thalassoglobus polymorphus TaxID=2527994 RepID=A0A517QHJ1_9PLAN|nr:tetraacyldisaccharide 4'-kinase [Thalassoglobus polymorphus]QDT31099.1 Tetraacyldisaccharide 4'-kinase [Thalassoglobus polymorphus]